MRTISNLREVCKLCQVDSPLGVELSRWLGQSLQSFLDRDCDSLDEALGLRFERGGVPWWLEEAMRNRDEALRELARRCGPGQTKTGVARHIHTMTVRYASSAWRFDREREEMPDAYIGTDKEFLWRAFNSGGPMPLGERQLRNIIAGAVINGCS